MSPPQLPVTPPKPPGVAQSAAADGIQPRRRRREVPDVQGSVPAAKKPHKKKKGANRIETTAQTAPQPLSAHGRLLPAHTRLILILPPLKDSRSRSSRDTSSIKQAVLVPTVVATSGSRRKGHNEPSSSKSHGIRITPYDKSARRHRKRKPDPEVDELAAIMGNYTLDERTAPENPMDASTSTVASAASPIEGRGHCWSRAKKHMQDCDSVSIL